MQDEIKLVANADGVETGVSRAKRSLASLGQAADQVGEQGEKGFRRFGAGSDEAGRRVESTTKNMVASLQRQIAALEAGGTATRQYQESIARLRGANMGALKPWLDQLDAAREKAENASKAQKGLRESISSVADSSAVAARAMGALGLVLSAAFSGASVKAAADVADNLDDMAEKSGIAVRELSALRYAGEVVGTPLESISTGIRKLGQNMAAAAGGAKEQAAAFKAVGVSIRESDGSLRSQDAVLADIATKFAGYRDGAEKSALAIELFGKQGEALIPLLNQGASGIASLRVEGEKLGAVFGGEVAKQAADFNDSLKKIQLSSEGARLAVAGELLPTLNQLTQAFIETREGSNSLAQMLGTGVRTVVEASVILYSDVMFVLKGIGREIGAIGAQFAALATLNFKGFTAISEAVKEDGKRARAELDKFQRDLLNSRYLNSKAGAGRGTAADPRSLGDTSTAAPIVPSGGGSGADAALNDALAARLQAYKNNDKAILDNRKAFYDTLGLLTKLGTKSELDAVEESLAKEEEVWAERKANFTAELAEATKKKNSQAEIARITGQMQDAERDYYQTVAKLRADATLAEQKYSDALSDRITKQLAAAGAAQEQVRLAQLEGKAIGLTGDALREHNQLQVEDKARRLEALALWASGVDVSGKLAQAYLDEAAALRKLHTEQGANRSAQLVNEYVKGIEESNKLLQAELGLMGQSEQARNTALEQLRIQLDLEKKIAEVKALEGDTPERAARIAQLEAGAAIAKANAANKAFLDEWKTSVGKYDDIFRQGFADMLNSGKDGWKSFTKSLATTFKTTVADTLYKAFAQPFVVNIVGNLLGLLGGGASAVVGGAAAAASGGSALSGLGTLASGASLIAGNFGAGLTTGLGQLMSGNIIGGLQLGGGLIGSGATAGGLGTIMGVLGPIALGVGALMAIAKATKGETRTGGQFGVAFDGSVTNQRRGETYTYQGQQFDRDFSNGQRNALIAGQAYRLEGDPVQNEQAIRDAVSGTASGINAFLKALGSKATLTGFSAGLETSSKGRGGVFAGGILSDGTTFGESGKGDNYAGTLYEKFSTNSPDFKTALENFTLDLKQSTIQALQSVTDIPETVQKLLKGVDAEGLSEEAANKLLETINAQIVGVNQFKDALKGMGLDTLAALSFDAAAGLAEVSGGFDKLLGNLGTYYSNFFSPEEQRANMQRQLREQLASLNLTLPDINATDARAQYRRLVETAEKDLSEEGRKTYATLLQLAGAFAGITTAAEDAAQALERQRSSASDLFQQALRRDRDAIGAQVSILQASIDAGRSLVDMLRGSARDLLGSVDDSRNMLAAQGMVYIERAIAGLQSGGRLADYTGLSGAVDAAVSGISGGTYRNDTERAYDAKVLAGQLNTLGNLEDLSLSIEEQQLAVLNKELDRLKGLEDQAKATVEGLTTLTGTVDFYLAELLKLFKPEAADTTTTGGSSAGGGFSFGGSSSAPSKQPGPGDKAANGNYVREQYLGGGFGSTYSAVSDGEQKLLEGLSSGLMTQFAGTGDVAGLLSAAKDAGYTLSDLATVGGYNYLDVLDKARALGIPAFAVGTNYVPQDMLAQIHEGEAIVPKAFNPWANGYAGGVGDNAVLIAEIRALREEVAALRAASEDAADSGAQTADVLTRVTRNGNGMVMSETPL
ncbi:hypothetical protein [Acidovorax sp. K2F]|uniref:hypothetical protein n=1 Tax=Acidovorax sp. K2F TaxID=2978125 RepID=UPI0021B0B4CC|nr:hypothetical protein [Acidovorax sp. K2F]MCT6721657.1 hypothetical protein [Acidovorax sp. K2F]